MEPCWDVPFVFVKAERVNFHVFESPVKESLLGPGINEGVGLFFMQYPMEAVVEFIAFLLVEGDSGFFNQCVGLSISKTDIV